jgi:hypothetical protein
MLVDRDRVLDGDLQQFVLAVCRYRDAAVRIAGKLAAVDVFTGHGDLPSEKLLTL